jgi:hypothetical protein
MSRGYDAKKIKLRRRAAEPIKKPDLSITINASEIQRAQNNNYIEKNLLSNSPRDNNDFKQPSQRRPAAQEPAGHAAANMLSDSFSSMRIDDRVKSNIDSEN